MKWIKETVGTAESINKIYSPTNPIIFFDIQAGDHIEGRVIIELRADTVPKTAENFRLLATDENGHGYKGCTIYQVCSEFIQAGRLSDRQNFSDENFDLKHDSRGVVSMANDGPNRNGSEFFITTCAMKNLDDRHVVFGKVIEGSDVIDTLVNKYSSSSREPTEIITIVNCGQLDSLAKPEL